MSNHWDREVDLLVVGTGAAGLTAAITAADAGLATLVVESTERWGGTTMRSGGGLWMPTNPLISTFAAPDSVEDALTYLEAAIGDAGPASSPERRLAFVNAVIPVFRMLERLGMQWSPAKQYPDYYPDRPGGRVGRSIEPKPFDAKRLGDAFATSRAGDGLPVPLKNDDVWLLSRAWSTPSGFVRGARFVFRMLGGIVTGKKLYGMGSALAMSLMQMVRTQGTEVLLSSPLTDLVLEDGVVVGAVVTTPTGELRIRTRRGVMLGAGGFAMNTAWREKYHGIPGYSSAADGDLGTAIEIGAKAGGALALMDDAWWGASVPIEGKQALVRAQRAQRSVQHRRRSVGPALPQRVRELHRLRPRPPRAQPHHAGEPVVAGRRQAAPPALHVRRGPDRRQEAARVGDAREGRHHRRARDAHGRRRRDAAGDDRPLQRLRPHAASTRTSAAAARSYDNYYGDPRVKPNPNLGADREGSVHGREARARATSAPRADC